MAINGSAAAAAARATEKQRDPADPALVRAGKIARRLDHFSERYRPAVAEKDGD